MNNKIKLFIYAIVLLCSIFLYELFSNNHSVGSTISMLEQRIVYLEDSLEQANQCLSLLDSNERLRQHFIAVKYSGLKGTKENIEKFLVEADVLNRQESFHVALRETANGKTGIGRNHANNHFGMRRANMRFTWGNGITNNNYVTYESWPFSYLDYDEYLKAGNKTWRKDLPKNLVKNDKTKSKSRDCYST